MKMQFFARSFSIFILISPIIRAKHHTAMRHDCLHAMPRFHITSAQDGDFVTKANYVLLFYHHISSESCGRSTSAGARLSSVSDEALLVFQLFSVLD